MDVPRPVVDALNAIRDACLGTPASALDALRRLAGLLLSEAVKVRVRARQYDARDPLASLLPRSGADVFEPFASAGLQVKHYGDFVRWVHRSIGQLLKSLSASTETPTRHVADQPGASLFEAVPQMFCQQQQRNNHEPTPAVAADVAPAAAALGPVAEDHELPTAEAPGQIDRGSEDELAGDAAEKGEMGDVGDEGEDEDEDEGGAGEDWEEAGEEIEMEEPEDVKELGVQEGQTHEGEYGDEDEDEMGAYEEVGGSYRRGNDVDAMVFTRRAARASADEMPAEVPQPLDLMATTEDLLASL